MLIRLEPFDVANYARMVEACKHFSLALQREARLAAALKGHEFRFVDDLYSKAFAGSNANAQANLTEGPTPKDGAHVPSLVHPLQSLVLSALLCILRILRCRYGRQATLDAIINTMFASWNLKHIHGKRFRSRFTCMHAKRNLVAMLKGSPVAFLQSVLVDVGAIGA
jgi:hypothetical protein